jgi:hypothetical protein
VTDDGPVDLPEPHLPVESPVGPDVEASPRAVRAGERQSDRADEMRLEGLSALNGLAENGFRVAPFEL